MIEKNNPDNKYINQLNPQLTSLPQGVEERLIDRGMLHFETSLAGLAERYQRGATSHTVHVWWARRPHTAMRSLCFASLSKDHSKNALELMKNLGYSLTGLENDINSARKSINTQYDAPPKVLDMFAGGGTIPFEFANLGVKSYALDRNELSVFIQTCNLIYSQKVNKTLCIQLLKSSGQRVIRKLEDLSSPLFPLRDKNFFKGNNSSPIGYLWSYSKRCEICDYKFYLTKRPWLSRKKNKSVAFMINNGESKQIHQIGSVDKNYKYPSNWTGTNGKVKCPKCNHVHDKLVFNEIQDELCGIIRLQEKSGKVFDVSTLGAIPPKQEINVIEKDTLEFLNSELPTLLLPNWSGIVNPAGYGLNTYSDILNPRQRTVLLLLIKILTEEYVFLNDKYPQDVARYVIYLLSGLIDQLIDWNCRLSIWISQNEQVGRAFCGPGIPMYWDYVEIDPVMNGPANLRDKLTRIIKGAASIDKFPYLPDVRKGKAQSLPFEEDFFDVVLTDPPYYDNIYYSILSDFFYVWKRLLFKTIEPELFFNSSTTHEEELVASSLRSGSNEKAHEDYCKQLGLAIKEAERVLRPDGVFGFIYSHSSLQGWEAIIRAFRPTNFIISSVQPLSIERRQRPRAMTSEAVNTCITFVARRDNNNKIFIDFGYISEKITKISEILKPDLLQAGWNEVDIGMAVFAHGVALLSNAKGLQSNETDVSALKKLALIVKEQYPHFRITNRKSL